MTAEHDRLAIMAAFGKVAWPHVASFSGAVITLAFVERLTIRGKAFAVFFGFWVATLLGPIGHAFATHYAPFIPVEVVAPGINFLVALTAMAVVPGALKAIGTVASDPAWVRTLLRTKNDEGGYGRYGGGRAPYQGRVDGDVE